jgi:hypothetical protein
VFYPLYISKIVSRKFVEELSRTFGAGQATKGRAKVTKNSNSVFTSTY